MDAVVSSGPLPPSSDLHAITSLVVPEVARRLGRRSRWNGQVYLLRRPRSASAASLADGRLAVNRDDVLRPLDDALRVRRRGRPLSPMHAHRLRDAFDTLVHESCHLASYGPADASGATDVTDVTSAASATDDTEVIGAAEDTYAPDALRAALRHLQVVRPDHADTGSVADRAASGALHEGLVRLWTERNLDGVLADVGLAGSFPELAEVRRGADGPRPALLGIGAQAVVAELGLVTGRRSDEILHRMMTAHPGAAWTEAAELVLGSRFPNRTDPGELAAVRSRLAEVGRAAYAGVVSAYLSPARMQEIAWEVAAAGREAVRATIAAGESERRALTGERHAHLTALPGGLAADPGPGTSSVPGTAADAVRAALSGQVPLVAGSEAIAIDPAAPTPSTSPTRDEPGQQR